MSAARFARRDASPYGFREMRRSIARLTVRRLFAVVVALVCWAGPPFAPLAAAEQAGAPVCTMACCEGKSACCCRTGDHEADEAESDSGPVLHEPSLVESCPPGCAQAVANASGFEKNLAASADSATIADPHGSATVRRFTPAKSHHHERDRARAPPIRLL